MTLTAVLRSGNAGYCDTDRGRNRNCYLGYSLTEKSRHCFSGDSYYFSIITNYILLIPVTLVFVYISFEIRVQAYLLSTFVIFITYGPR